MATTHAGFLVGIYTSAGNMTCHAKKANCNNTCNVGSLGHYEQDAKTFAAWELDFIKMDWCSASVAHLSCEKQYGDMAQALNATGRPITFYMSCGGNGAKSTWASVLSEAHLTCCPPLIVYGTTLPVCLRLPSD